MARNIQDLRNSDLCLFHLFSLMGYMQEFLYTLAAGIVSESKGITSVHPQKLRKILENDYAPSSSQTLFAFNLVTWVTCSLFCIY